MKPTDPLDLASQLISALEAPQLWLLHSYLNRTRKRTYPFTINGSTVMTTRRWARDAVAAELKTCGNVAPGMPQSDPLAVWATPPGKGRTAVRAS